MFWVVECQERPGLQCPSNVLPFPSWHTVFAMWRGLVKTPWGGKTTWKESHCSIPAELSFWSVCLLNAAIWVGPDEELSNQLTEQWEIINCCIQPLYFGVVCHTSIGNCCRGSTLQELCKVINMTAPKFSVQVSWLPVWDRSLPLNQPAIARWWGPSLLTQMRDLGVTQVDISNHLQAVSQGVCYFCF